MKIRTLFLIAIAALPLLGDIVTTMPPLTTKRPYLPRKKSGYSFASNIENTAYVSNEACSMIHFMPVNNSKKPILYLAVPKEIQVIGAFRHITVEKQPDFKKDGISYTLYRMPQRNGTCKYTYFWRLTKPLPEGTKLKGWYWGTYDKGEQPPQPLKIQVVKIPKVASFKRLPVYLSMPVDFYAAFPDFQGLKNTGFNHLDFWSYLQPSERDWGIQMLDQMQKKAKKNNIEITAWIQEWWWHNGKKEDGKATLIDGTQTDAMLCLSYRGIYYQKLIDQGKYLIDRGIYFHSSDPEMYGNGDTICFCDKCRAHFKQWLTDNHPKVTWNDPTVFEKKTTQYPQLHDLWNQWKCLRYAEFFKFYRQTMVDYMKSKGIKEPFQFIVYCSYHRSFPGFQEYKDYRTSHSYLKTLEDPAAFKGVFDYLGPMSYMDVYANYKDYNMLLPAEDTAILRKITNDSIPVAPILCAGYPFVYAFGSDLNAEMLQYNMLEVIGAGGKGFGFWGECPFDAADMRAVARVVGMLSPYEEIILNGKATNRLTPISNNTILKRIEAPQGSLVLVSEYSRTPLTVVFDCPVNAQSRIINLSTGKQIGTVNAKSAKVTVTLDTERAVMLYIGK